MCEFTQCIISLTQMKQGNATHNQSSKNIREICENCQWRALGILGEHDWQRPYLPRLLHLCSKPYFESKLLGTGYSRLWDQGSMRPEVGGLGKCRSLRQELGILAGVRKSSGELAEPDYLPALLHLGPLMEVSHASADVWFLGKGKLFQRSRERGKVPESHGGNGNFFWLRKDFISIPPSMPFSNLPYILK